MSGATPDAAIAALSSQEALRVLAAVADYQPRCPTRPS